MALTKIPSSLLDTSGGFDLQGNITLGANEEVQFGDASELKIFNDGTNSVLRSSDNLLIQRNTTPRSAITITDSTGEVALAYGGSTVFQTSSTGATVTGNLAVTGDLDITGNVNSASVTDLDVTDKTITLGAGQTEALSGGSGIIIDGSSASILWDETNSEFDINNSINVSGTTPTITISDSQNKSWTSSDTIYGKVSFKTLDASGIGAHETAYVGVHADVASSTTAAGRLVFGTSNANAVAAETMTLDGNGFLGLGTSNPNQLLHLDNSTNTTDEAIIRIISGNAGLSGIYLGDPDYGSISRIRHDHSDNTLQFWGSNVAGTSSLQRMTIAPGGNVGIGTSSPAKNLEIFGSGSESGILVKNDTNTNYRGYYISSVESDNTAYGKLHMDVNSGELNITSGYSDWGGFITFDTNGTQRMRIDTNGEISMGWNSGGGPGGGLLQVNGGGLFTNGGAGYVQGSILLRSSNNDETPSYRGQGVFTWNVGHQVSWFMGTPYTDGDLFTINRKSSESSFTQESSYIGHANTNNFFTIKNNGCVGLGNVNPTESLYVGNINAGGADVSLALQNTISNRISSLKIYDESGNNKVNLNYDNGSNRGTLSMGDADGEIIYIYDGSTIKSGFGIDLSGSSRELSIFHTSSGTDGNIALGKRLESNGTFYETVQVTPAGTAGTANLIVHNVNSNAFNHVQENKVPNLTAGEDVFLGLGKSTNTKNMGYLGYEWNASGSDSNYIHLSHWGADGLFRVYGNGNYSFSGSNVSDRDLKENIVAITDTALDKVTQLVVKKFNFIKDYEVSSDGTEVETPRTQVGFIAQEVEAIIPDITVGTDGQKDMGVDTVGLVGYLTKAIQELKTELDAAKARITELEG